MESQVELKALAIENKKKELAEMERRLKEQQEDIARQMEEFKSMKLVMNKPGIHITTPSLSDSATPDSSTLCTETKSDNSYKKSYMDDTGNLIGNQNRSSVTPSPHGHKKSIFHPSPTVNTKEALALMQQLWSTSTTEIDSNTSEPTPVPGSRFQIFSDENSEPPPSAKFEIFADKTEEVPKLPVKIPFQIFTDDKENAMTGFPIKGQTAKANVFNFDKENLMVETPENNENMPPLGLIQTTILPRSKTGILTPAEYIEWMPLEEQEKLLDEDERMQEASLGIAKPIMGNATMILPDEDDFFKMSKISSTPFTGRSFVPMEDENTCDVQLIFNKKPDDSLVMPPPFGQVLEAPPLTPLSPIVETSREHYKSSSSSSGADTTHGTTRGDHSKSHWGNTGVSTHFKTADNTAGFGLSLRTPGNGLLSNCASGYNGDKSSMSSSSAFKSMHVHAEKAQSDFGQRMASVGSQDDDQTGMFSDMLAEFKQVLSKPGTEENHMEHSVHPSFLEPRERSEYAEHSLLHQSSIVFTDGKHTVSSSSSWRVQELSLAKPPGLNTTDADFPRHDLTSGPANNMTGVNLTHSSLRLGMTGVPGLDMTGAPGLDMTEASSLSRTGLLARPYLDMTGAPGLDMTGASSLSRTGLDLSEDHIESLANSLDFSEYNPFSMEWQEKLMSCVSVPVDQRHGYVRTEDKLPNVRIKSNLTLGNDK